MMRHPEHHHVPPPPSNIQRNRVQQMPPNRGTQPMLMSLQATVPVPHSGVLVSMPQGPPLLPPTSMPQQPQQPKTIMQQQAQQVYHYESTPVDTPEHQTQHQNENEHPVQVQQQSQQQIQNSPNTSTSSGAQQTLANTKEKTPMCLINELARYNKIQHQYRLTGEQGPAHKKLFTVTLKLGNEDYEAEGPSIKKAQHAAAALALQRTELKHPPPKTARINRSGIRGTGMVTPTVELNALAMKRGERTIYMLENGPTHQAQGYMSQSGYYPRHGMYSGPGQPRYANYDLRRGRGYHAHYDRYYGQYRPGFQHPSGETVTVRLHVGDREYAGVGFTVQAARHDAAAKALEDIKRIEAEEQQQQQQCNAAQENGYMTSNGSINQDLNTELKSPISLVHEIALKRNLNVAFEVLSEKGPPHMKVFVTQCRVGDLVATGEGNGKKISKKKAAEKMLEELAKQGPLISPNSMNHLKRKRVVAKKKTRNLIKVNADKNSEYTEEINPISRLIQIQQANKEKEPVYTVVEERGAPRRREFVIEASVNGHSCTGIGPNKKIAKRKAAEALLNLLGYSNNNATAQNTPKPVLKSDKEPELVEKLRKVTFLEEKAEVPVGGSGGRQLVPGLLLVGDQSANFQQNKPKVSSDLLNSGSGVQADGKKTGQAQVSKLPSQTTQSVRAKDQLIYLAQLLGVQVQFSDFPKANHEMYLTLVSLSTQPPQVCHGEGPTTEASHEKAALEALKVLSELGLDNVTPNKENIEGVQNANKPQVVQKTPMNQNGIKK